MKKNALKQIHRLWGHLEKSRRRQCIQMLMLIIIASVAEMASISAVLPFLGALLEPARLMQNVILQPLIFALDIVQPSELLLPLTILFCVLIIVSALLRLLLLRVQIKISHGIGSDISVGIYRRTLYQPYAKLLLQNSSELIAGITSKADNVVHLVLLPAFGLIASCVMLVSILSVLLFIDWQTTLICLIGLGFIYGGVANVAQNKLASASGIINTETGRVIKILQEGFGGIRDVIINANQEAYCELFNSSNTRLREARAKIAIITGMPRFIIEASAIIIIAIFAYVKTVEDAGLIGLLPVLGAFALCAQRMLPVIQQGYASWSSIKGFSESLNDALNLLDQPLPEQVGECRALAFHDSINLININFKYTQNGPLVLDKLNINIRKGSRVGIIGKTGEGKSTLLDVVMGLLELNSGGIFVDGVEINKNNMSAWRLHIGHVPQTIHLSDATIAENIAFGVNPSDIDFTRVRVSACKAQISSDIECLDMQYHTIVGERGVRLSGGQRQRIGLARAFYKDADVIILDEATSALDEQTEAAVLSSIDQLDKRITVLFIAHRKSALRYCDVIIELRDGKAIVTEVNTI